jgi:hypothetical protein
MKIIITTILINLLIGVVCFAQNQTDANKVSDKLIDHIVGTWKVSSGTSIGNTAKAKPHSNTSDKKNNNKKVAPAQFNFKRNMRYTANMEGNSVADSGSYRLNENHGRLYLQSDLNNKQPMEWDIKINNNTLTLQADSVKHSGHIKYFYQRTGLQKD